MMNQDDQEMPPSYPRVREMATRILKETNESAHLEKKWIHGFCKRNPRIISLFDVKIDTKRIVGTRHDIMKAFYDRFAKVMHKYNVEPAHIWHMDKTGCHVGKGCNGWVLGRNCENKKTLVKDSENREWVTILECINGVGDWLRPLVIFKEKKVQSTWFLSDCPRWRYTCTENGWTSNPLGMDWLMNSFIKEAVPSSGAHSILIMDNHRSHSSVEIEYECLKHNIHLVYLPPHSSHILQPLDSFSFGPLKQRCKNYPWNLQRVI